VPGIDATRPSVARVYDFWLGGKDNFAVDRETGGRMAEVNPSLPRLVRDNRQFLCAAAARAAGAGVAQFLDLGAGLPAHPAVHEAVREVNADARACYVDNDTAAALHAAVLLADGEGLAAVQADLTDPGSLLARPEVRAMLDFGRPVGIVLGAAVTSWLEGLEIVPPGVCEAGRWVAGTGGVPTQRPVYPLAAAAVKTGE